MKLEIVTGQPNIDLDDKFIELLKQNGYATKDIGQKHAIVHPEKHILQQRKLYDAIRKIVKEHIENDSDLFILTYSDHVLNAVRVEIKKHCFSGGKVHQFIQEGEDICANISGNGRLDIWVDNIFDVWDKVLLELL